jgi:hypothetical protein
VGYKILGYVVWNGGKWYLGRRYGHLVPSRRVALAAVAAVGLAAVGLTVAARSGQD